MKQISKQKYGIILFGFAICVGIAVVFLRSYTGKEKIHRQTRFLMGTYCTIQAVGKRSVVMPAISRALDRMEEVDKKFTVVDPESPLYRFNHNNESIRDTEIIDLLETALEISSKSGGAFDCTVYPLISLWGFYGEEPALPAKKDITDCLKEIRRGKLVIKNDVLSKKNKKTGIDLGGIAKGYGIREAAAVLKEEGISDALIDAGGDIYALGTIRNSTWKIGIRNPRGEGIVGIVGVSDKAVVTSGDYERFFEENGLRYHHIIDPHTGYPARGLTSVTVLAPDPARADAWSTALFVIGRDAGMKLVEQMPDIEALMITDENKLIYSSGFGNSFEKIQKN